MTSARFCFSISKFWYLSINIKNPFYTVINSVRKFSEFGMRWFFHHSSHSSFFVLFIRFNFNYNKYCYKINQS